MVPRPVDISNPSYFYSILFYSDLVLYYEAICRNICTRDLSRATSLCLQNGAVVKTVYYQITL